jgi:hypothetical protein
MTAIVYPVGLPAPTQWVAVPRERRASSSLPGNTQLRGRSRDQITDVEASWIYSPDEMGEWRTWYEDTLLYGMRWFAIEAPGAGGWIDRVCRFRTGTVRREFLGRGYFRVSARLEQRGRSLLPDVFVPLPFILLSNFESPDEDTSVTDEAIGNDPVVYSDTHVELLTRVTATQPKFGSQSWEVNYQETASFTNRVLVYESNAAYELPGAFTLAYWVRPDGDSGSQFPDVLCCSFATDGNTPDDISFGINIISTQPHVYIADQAYTAATSGLSPVPRPAGQWAHMEMSRDDSDTLRCFVNGVLAVYEEGVGGTLVARDIIVGGFKKSTILPNVYSIGVEPKFYDSIALLKGLCLHTANFTPPTVPYSMSMTLEQAQGVA